MSAALTALFACSSDPVNPPAELTDFEPGVYAKRVWKRPVGVGGDDRELQFQALLSENSVITVDADGRLNSINAETGWRNWRTDLDERIIGGLAEDSRNLYLSNYQGEFIAFNRDKREVEWRVPLASEVLSPAGTDGRFVAAQSISDSVFLFSALDGTLLWKYDQETPLLSLRGTASPVIVGDNVLLTSFANGELYAFAIDSGEVLWRYAIANAKGRTELERLIDADGSPIVEDGVVYASAYQGAVAAVDLRTGTEIWNKSLSTATSLALYRDSIFATLDDGSIVSLNKFNGDELWRTSELSYRRLGAPSIADGLLVTEDFEGYVHVISTDNGTILARLRPDSDGVMGKMLFDGHHLYAYTSEGGVVAYHLLQ